MSYRLSKIDELSLGGHYYLEEGDDCLYFGEYTVDRDWSYSDTNQLIHNFKKDMSLRHTDQRQFYHKRRAIMEVGKLIADTINPDKEWTSTAIIVPVPPSKIKTDPDYDPRMLASLQCASKKLGFDLPICECISQRESTDPDHASNKPRLPPKDRASTYDMNLDIVPENTLLAIIVDDVVATGSHYKGIEIVLKNYIPEIRVQGLFIARTVLPNPLEGFSVV